jgi:hypothetical protein
MAPFYNTRNTTGATSGARTNRLPFRGPQVHASLGFMWGFFLLNNWFSVPKYIIRSKSLDGHFTIIKDKNREQQSVFMTLEYFPEMGEVEWLCAS